MTVFGTVTLCNLKNIGGSTERSIVGLFGHGSVGFSCHGSVGFMRTSSLQLHWCLFPLFRVRYYRLSTFLYARA